MTVEEAVRARILDIGLTALLDAPVYLDKFPQRVTTPAILVQLVDDPLDYHLRGKQGVNRARVQVDVIAEEASGVDPYYLASTIAATVDGDALGPNASGLSGWMGSIGSPPIDIQAVQRLARLRRYDGDERRIVTITQDYWIWYQQNEA